MFISILKGIWYAGRNEIPTCIPHGHLHSVIYQVSHWCR